MRFKHGVVRFLKDETGQTTTEYILILAVVVTLIMQFKKQFKIIIGNLLDNVKNNADEATLQD